MKFLIKLKYFFVLSILLIGFAFIQTRGGFQINAEERPEITDQNGDGIINLADARILKPPATANCPVCVDINQDQTIDQKDINLLKYNVGLGNGAYKVRLDINNDGKLSQEDIDIIQNYLGQTVTGPAFGLDNPSELTFGFVANEVLVKFKDGVTGQQKSPVFSKYNVTSQASLTSINADKIRTTTSNVEALQKQLDKEPGVEKTYKNHIGEWLTNDTFWDSQWGHKKIRIEETWNTETKGSENNPVRVGLIDSGVDKDNVDLLHNISWEGINLVPGEEINEMSDENGHGTAMAGIIGATTDNSTGIAGLNYEVDIVPAKVGFTGPNDYAVSVAFEWLTARVKVINMSFGMGYIDETNYLPNEYLRRAREDKGISLIAAAGEDGRNDCAYPARHINVVCVGSTDENDALCNTSNGRTDADILAPGNNIITTVPTGHPLDPDQDGIAIIPGCNTSVATAYISGVTALCRNVSFLPLSTEITREDLKCKNLVHQGYGRVDAWGTVWYKNCHKFDFNADNKLDVFDIQAMIYIYYIPGAYNVKYDIFPVGGDGKIDAGDVLTEFARTGGGLECTPI